MHILQYSEERFFNFLAFTGSFFCYVFAFVALSRAKSELISLFRLAHAFSENDWMQRVTALMQFVQFKWLVRRFIILVFSCSTTGSTHHRLSVVAGSTHCCSIGEIKKNHSNAQSRTGNSSEWWSVKPTKRSEQAIDESKFPWCTSRARWPIGIFHSISLAHMWVSQQRKCNLPMKMEKHHDAVVGERWIRSDTQILNVRWRESDVNGWTKNCVGRVLVSSKKRGEKKSAKLSNLQERKSNSGGELNSFFFYSVVRFADFCSSLLSCNKIAGQIVTQTHHSQFHRKRHNEDEEAWSESRVKLQQKNKNIFCWFQLNSEQTSILHGSFDCARKASLSSHNFCFRFAFLGYWLFWGTRALSNRPLCDASRQS